MTAELNGLSARQHTENLPPRTGPQLQLAELFPPYTPANAHTYPEYALARDDVDTALAERDETNRAHLQRMNLRCVALEQIMDISDQTHVSVDEPEFGDQSTRVETINVALLEVKQHREMKAIGCFGRVCQLPKSGADDMLISVRYTLESLRVLPAHRGKGFDRALAAGMAALIARELENLTETLWHTQTLTVQVRLRSRLNETSGVLKRIVSGRLRDELVAQDSMLQLDGKLSRFLPLGN